ncbi:MAG: Flp pilus assembly protein CpaB [Bacillota bacterium]|jgi:pilus assembly protein CpaB
MERTNRRLILIALVFACMAGLGIYLFMDNLQTVTTIEHTDAVVVALTNIPARAVVNGNMVEVQRVPKGTVHIQAVTTLDQVVGKTTTGAIVAGEQVLQSRLFANAESAGLSFQLPEGKRAVSVGINSRIAVSYLLRPGDAVDVLISYEQTEGNQRESHTAVMLQNIKVLAVGSELRVGARAPGDAETITLAVSPAEAEKLAWAEDYGRIRLALRPATDEKLISTPGQSATTVAGGR